MNNTGMKFGGRQKGTPNKRIAITVTKSSAYPPL